MSLLPRDDALALPDRRQIDEICLAFEDRWLAGQQPVMEAYVGQASAPLRPSLLKELLLVELDYRRSIRETPRVEDYVSRFPEWESSVRTAFQTAFAREVTVRHLPGTCIGRYRVRRLLGAGTFAAVYLAWDEQLCRDVAVKVPHPACLADAAQRQRFVEEARAVAALKHSGIVALYDAAETEDGAVYLVMQYVPGQSLRQLLDQRPITPEEACRILAEVADAIDAAHHTGVIHRDLKPGNILLDEQNRPHVCDFGLALREHDQPDRRGEYAGTLSYMAPEQLRGQSHQLDGRADIWAMGVILYEMLTGRQPFVGRTRAELAEEVLTRDPRPPRQIDARIGRAAERICLHCVEKRPAHRFPTARDLADELRRARGEPRRAWRTPLVGAALLVCLVLASLGLGAWWSRSRPLAAPPVPLEGSLELSVWNPAEPLRQGVPISREGVAPLRSGDRVRLDVQLNQPAHLYLLWLDTHALPAPVYPWRAGDWNRLPAALEPARFVTLPEDRQGGWTVRTSHSGTETLLLLVRRTPLPAGVDLRELLHRLPRDVIPGRPHVITFRDGKPLDEALMRDAQFDQPVDLGDPLLALQQELVQILSPHFELIHAVSFPIEGD